MVEEESGGLSGVDPTHVLSCNHITLKVKIPTYTFQGDILQIIAIAICLHFGINCGIYFFMGMIRHAFAGTGKYALKKVTIIYLTFKQKA